MKACCQFIQFLKIILLIKFFCLSANTFSQSGKIQWQKTYGGSQSEIGRTIQQTSDGGYIMIGSAVSSDGNLTSNHGFNDAWVVKVNSMGAIEWQRAYGGSSYDDGLSIRQTPDGGYVFVGVTWSTDGDVTHNNGLGDLWIVKLNNSGAIQWQKTYGGSRQDEGLSIELTSDGGYIVAGSTQSNDGDITFFHGRQDYWVVKLTGTGALQWQRTYGGTKGDIAMSIAQTLEGGYIIGGHTYSNDGDVTGLHGDDLDCWIVKINSTGNLQWQKTLGGSDLESCYRIRQVKDGGYIVVASTNSNNGDVTNNKGISDGWLVKLSSNGNIEWQRTYGGTESDGLADIHQTADGGYIVGGSVASNDGDATSVHDPASGYFDFWVLKIKATGAIEWQKNFGGSFHDFLFSLQPTHDGGFILIGETVSNDGDLTMNNGMLDYWVVKIGPEVITDKCNTDVIISPVLFSSVYNVNYNRPCAEFVVISLYNDIGQLLFRSKQTTFNGSYSGKIDLFKYPNAIYFVEFVTSDDRTTKKVMKL